MIYKNGKEIAAIYYGKVALSAIYKGSVPVWQAVRSCFGSGRWISKKPWIGKEKWKYKNQ